MSRLEIIHLRTSARSFGFLGKQIREAVKDGEEGVEAVTIWRRSELGTDVAVHIHNCESPGIIGPGALGLHLAQAMRAYGLVEHTVWEELP